MHRVSICKVKKIIASLSFQASRYYATQQHHSDRNISEYLENPPWRIMFFGSDDFAVKSLQALCSKLRTETLISKLEVTTTTAVDWKNEKNIIHRFAESSELKIHPWPIDTTCIRNHFDIGIVVSFGCLIPKKVIESFPLGVLNVHGSLLPKWRGAAPIVHAILHGDSTTGVTIMKIKPHKFDTGDIVRQYSVPIKADETAAQLTNRLAILGAQLLMECIRNLPRSVSMTVPQQDSCATYVQKIEKIERVAFYLYYNSYKWSAELNVMADGLITRFGNEAPNTIMEMGVVTALNFFMSQRFLISINDQFPDQPNPNLPQNWRNNILHNVLDNQVYDVARFYVRKRQQTFVLNFTYDNAVHAVEVSLKHTAVKHKPFVVDLREEHLTALTDPEYAYLYALHCSSLCTDTWKNVAAKAEINEAPTAQETPVHLI